METKLSLSTITLCIASLENLKEKIDESIDTCTRISNQVPTWMLETSDDYAKAIEELRKHI